MREILYIVLAGGTGEKLLPLTEHRPKPLVRFGSRGTIIDFTLYNCLASQNGDVLVLTQYLSDMVESYVRMYWMGAFSNSRRSIRTKPAIKSPKGRYLGTADAVYQALITEDNCPERVVILSADHVYRMDYRELIDFHRSADKPVTLARTHRPREARNQRRNVAAGIIDGLLQSPQSVLTLEDAGDSWQLSGIGVFERDFLIETLEEKQAAARHDLAADVVAELAGSGAASLFDFKRQDGSPAYFRKVADIPSYLRTQMDLLSDANLPGFDPIPGMGRLPFTLSDLISHQDGPNRSIENCLVARTARIGNARIKNSVIGPAVVVEDGAEVENSVLLDGSVVLRHGIIRNSLLEPLAVVHIRGANTYVEDEDGVPAMTLPGLTLPLSAKTV